jgi:hypothetical protein
MPDGKEVNLTEVCERITRLEVKMNIIVFISGAALMAAIATLIKILAVAQ